MTASALLVVGVAALWVAVYTAAAALAALRAHGRRAGAPPAGAADHVLLVRPLAGDEPELGARLRCTGGAPAVLFAVGAGDDGALPVAEEAAAALRERGVAASVLLTHAVGPNHKADQLARALLTPEGRSQAVLVIADSDVALEPDTVLRLVAAMGGADAAWAPPVERGPRATWGDRASHAVLDASLHAFPFLAGLDPGALVGKLLAVRREALDAVGGFGALTAFLGEDVELARRLHQRAGASSPPVVVAPFVARAMASNRPLRDVLGRYARWLMVVRAQRPQLLPTYPLLLAAAPPFAAMLAVGAACEETGLVLAALTGLLVRLGVACSARSVAGESFAPARALAQAFLGDATLLVALAMALSTRRFTWRGRRLVLARGGALDVDASAPNASLGTELAS